MSSTFPLDPDGKKWQVSLVGPEPTTIEITVTVTAAQAEKLIEHENRRRKGLAGADLPPGTPIAGDVENVAEAVMSILQQAAT